MVFFFKDESRLVTSVLLFRSLTENVVTLSKLTKKPLELCCDSDWNCISDQVIFFKVIKSTLSVNFKMLPFF